MTHTPAPHTPAPSTAPDARATRATTKKFFPLFVSIATTALACLCGGVAFAAQAHAPLADNPQSAIRNPQSAAPAGLLVNGVANPLAVDADSVRFSWRLEGGRPARGLAQTGWQIRVASSRELLTRDLPDLWDSGKVASAQSASVEYAGKKLPPASRLWWDARVWDQNGTPGPRSAPAFFDTGLAQGDWTARYIWDGTDNTNNFAYFRKTFSVSSKPALAKVYVTAHSDYMLYFNGRLLGRGPARTDPWRHGQYNSHDITDLVKPGKNVLAAAGHWHGLWLNSGVSGVPAFLLEARLDGVTIGTDSSWKVLAHTGFIETDPVFLPVRKTNRPPRPTVNRPEPPGGWITDLDSREFGSETVIVRDGVRNQYVPYGGAAGSGNRTAIRFDARMEPANWQSIEFDDFEWAPATVVDRSDFRLFAQTAPLQNEQAELKPVRPPGGGKSQIPNPKSQKNSKSQITNSKKGDLEQVATRADAASGNAWFVDFGRCINGWPQLTMRGNRAGDVVRVEYFQRTGERNAAGWDEYTCRGATDGAPEIWRPGFGRHTSFQEIKITGYAGKLNADDVRAIWAYSDADVAGRFRCSRDSLNDIYEMCERSARQNVQQAMISVDANREQSQWTADSWNIGIVLLHNHRNTQVIDKAVRTYAAAQLPNGNFPACVPAQRSRCIPEWSMYWPMLLWEQHLFSGDTALLRDMAPRLERFLAWLKRYQDMDTKLIDPPGWRISNYAGGNTPNGGYNTATTCQYYENLRIAARVFAVLGDAAKSETYARQAQEVKDGINKHLFNGSYYIARLDGREKEMFPVASAWALRFDIAPEAERAKLIATITAPKTPPKLGGYCGDAFYSGLLRAGGGAFVARDMPPRYRPMLEGNRANWENLNGGGEVNHAWTAYPGYLFQKYILGIQPTSGGFATFDVRPETGGLTFAEGVVPTIKGDIVTRWEKTEDGHFKLTLTVPPNTRASVFIPKFGKKVTLAESNKQLLPRPGLPSPTPGTLPPGIITVSEHETSIQCDVGAGDYEFLAMAR